MKMLLLALTLCVSTSCSKADWAHFVTPDGTLQFSTPGPVTDVTQTTRVDTNAALQTLTMYVCETRDSRCFAVTSHPIAPEVIASYTDDEILDAARDGMISGAQATLISEAVISIGPVAGREITASAPGGGTMHSRIWVADGKKFVAQVVGPTRVMYTKDTDRFFKSIQFARPREASQGGQ